jgi:hypothetical protein
VQFAHVVGTKVAARRSTVWPCSTTPSDMMVPSPMVSAMVSTLHTAAGVSFSDTSGQLAPCELGCDDVPPLGVLLTRFRLGVEMYDVQHARDVADRHCCSQRRPQIRGQ